MCRCIAKQESKQKKWPQDCDETRLFNACKPRCRNSPEFGPRRTETKTDGMAHSSPLPRRAAPQRTKQNQLMNECLNERMDEGREMGLIALGTLRRAGRAVAGALGGVEW